MNEKGKRAAALIRSYRENILKFVYDECKINPDKWQERAFLEYARPDKKISRIGLAACAGPGKSCVLAICGLWFLCTQGHRGEHPKGAVVSETMENLKDNLWAELAKFRNISPLCSTLLRWTKTRIYASDHPETWFLSARSFNKDANAEDQGRTLSGLHSQYISFFIDESGKIPVSVAKAAEQALSVEDKLFARIITAGNPTSVDGLLYHIVMTVKGWTIIKITGDPDDPERSRRIDSAWAAEQILKYGRDDPWVQSYILGIFPEVGINTLFSLKDVEDAMRRNLDPSHFNTASKRLGVDVARFGHDSTIIFPRQGLRGYQFVEMRNARTNDIAARVALAKERWNSHLEFVDGTGGWGAGVVDSLIQAGYSPMEVHFSGKASDDRHKNKRSEMWFRMADWVKRGGILPPSNKLKKELIEQTYSFLNGKFILEDKERVRQRLGYSPDIADALALTFAIAESKAPVVHFPGAADREKKNWDYEVN